MTDHTSRLIVTSGASGFVGRHLAIRNAKNRSRQLCYVSPSQSEYECQGKRALAGIRTIEADLTRDCPVFSEQPAIIFHLAANSATWRQDHSCNDQGTRNFLSSFSRIGPGTHVVFTSSIAVMDNRADYSIPVSETTPTCHSPFTDYGQSKLEAEEWLKQEARERGFALTIVRPVTVYGPDARPNTVLNVLENWVDRNSSLARIPWPGKTGLIHVDDLVTVLLSLAELPPAPGTSETYLVQSEALTLGQVSQTICASRKVPHEPVQISKKAWRTLGMIYNCALGMKGWMPCRTYAAFWRLRIACENVFWCDTSKLRKALPDWKPSTLNQSLVGCRL